MPTGTTKPFIRGLRNGRRPAPSSERNHGLQAIQENAKAITKKEVSGYRVSRLPRGESDRSGASTVLMWMLLSRLVVVWVPLLAVAARGRSPAALACRL